MYILNPPLKKLWENKDPFKEVETLTGEVYRAVATRKTIKFSIDGYSFYLKLHHGITYGEFLKNIFSLHTPVLGARNEWRAIERLKSFGVDTMEGVAYGERGLNPIKRTSFIITKDLSPTISLEDFCKNWSRQPPKYEIKKTLIRKVATMVREMHKCGINHRDCYICHFLLHLPFNYPEQFKISVIDLHRAQIRHKVPLRWRNKDLVALYYSSLDIGLTQKDYFLFLKIYFEGEKLRDILTREKEFLSTVEHKSETIRERTLRKGL